MWLAVISSCNADLTRRLRCRRYTSVSHTMACLDARAATSLSDLRQRREEAEASVQYLPNDGSKSKERGRSGEAACPPPKKERRQP
ncbi:hypothetical protein MRX96_027839 [Rhipicephalus microplus]